jgi:hypothetical protein
MVSRSPDKFRFFKSASGISGGGFLFFALFFLRGDRYIYRILYCKMPLAVLYFLP